MEGESLIISKQLDIYKFKKSNEKKHSLGNKV